MLRNVPLFLAACLPLAPLACQVPAHAVQIGDSPYLFYDSSVLMLEDDVVLFLLQDAQNFERLLLASRSTDGGRTWPTTAQEIAPCSLGDARADGDLVVVPGLHDGTPIGPMVAFSADRGVSWTTRQLGNFGGYQTNAQVKAYVVGDTICVFWSEPSGQVIWMQRSGDAGQTWLPAPVLLSNPMPNPSPSWSQNLAVVGEGDELHVYWWTRSTSGSGRWLQSSFDAGQTWLASPRLVPMASGTSAAMYGHADLLLVRDAASVFRSVDDGVTWSPVVGLLATTIDDIAVAGQQVVVVGRSGTAQNLTWYVQSSFDGGATWVAPPYQVGSYPGFRGRLQVSGDDVFVGFRHSQNPDNDVLAHSGDQGATWRTFDAVAGTVVADRRRTVHLAFGPGLPSRPIYGYVGVGWTRLGAATTGTGGFAPAIGLSALPVLGRSLTVDVGDLVGGTVGVVGFSLANPVAAPFAGGAVWLQGPSTLLTFAANGAVGVAGDGAGSVPFAIPNQPALQGLRLTAQGAAFDPGAPASLVLTSGIEIWLR